MIVAGSVLAALILTIKSSRLVNFYDRWVHHKLGTQNNTKLWRLITFLNEPKLIAGWDVVLASLLFITGHPHLSKWVLITLIFTDLLGIFLKHTVKRARPKKTSPVRVGYSFPSGHVLSVTIMGLMLWHLFGKSGGLLLFLIIIATWLLVVISRLKTKAHYPSDIIGATTLGFFCFAIAQQLLVLV
ncbi:phosphatase PAP2 family protein [Lactobacillus sp. PV034]|uniref:phosphatase PAP2 family protein n=1 Tax=Lactobacillus sp. PV034 TaxID=2594495 RepID=UPI00223FE300|nr:phosphatase PAP2 family protein [Lactobacillus sp. PV034]QNQ81502.1 phosphatase PAP2 family protein [Lactobacillus sp. PV034]